MDFEINPKKVAFCIPTITKPHQQCLDALAASVPLLDAAGYDHVMVSEVGCPYISAARSTLLRKALDAKANIIVFIDHDLSWRPEDLLKLIETEGDVVSGLYRFKREPVEFMGRILLDEVDSKPIVRDDGAVEAFCIPAGFLKITRNAVNTFIRAYPELIYGEACNPCIDLFNHGAHLGTWYGEDYAFSRRWRDQCGLIWVVPDLTLTHHTKDAEFPGNYHEYLLACPGGKNHQAESSI